MLNLLQAEQDFVRPGTSGFKEFAVNEYDEADMLSHLAPVLPVITDIVPYEPRGDGAEDAGALVSANQIQTNEPRYLSLTAERRGQLVSSWNLNHHPTRSQDWIIARIPNTKFDEAHCKFW